MGRRWLWAQGSERFSENGTGDLLDMCEACHVTDILFLAHHSSQQALWNSEMFNSSSQQYGGLPYLDYLVRQEASSNIRVHGWLAVGTWPWMWGMLRGGTPDWRWSQADWLDMSRPDVQAAVGDAATDLCDHVPGLVGVHLDYIRIPNGVNVRGITEAHVTACVASARRATEAAGLELTAAVLPHTFPGWDMAECAQPWTEWLDDSLLDCAMPMLYYNASTIGGQMTHIENESSTVRAGTVIGVAPASPQEVFRSVPDWEAVLDLCVERGYDMSVFDDSWLRSEYRPALEQRPVPEEPVPAPEPVQPVQPPGPEPGDSAEDLVRVLTELAGNAEKLGSHIAALNDLFSSLNATLARLERAGSGQRIAAAGLLPSTGREDDE